MANTVLIIESDKATIAQAKAVAEAAGYRFLFAETAADGLSTATGQVPSIIFINLATPGTNGLEICKTLHNAEPITSVPIILITLRDGKFDPVYKKLYGIVSFLKKPFTDDEMTALIQEHSPLTEEEAPSAEEEPQGFGDMEMEPAAEQEEDAGAVFSIDDAQASLQDLQSNFQQPLEEEETTSAGEADEFEGTRPFSINQEEEGGAFGEVEPGGFGEAAGAEEESGGFGEGGAFGDIDQPDSGEAAGAEEESGGFGEGGAFGDIDQPDSGEAAGGEEESGGGFGASDDTAAFGAGAEEEDSGFGSGEDDDSGWGDTGGEEEAGESLSFGDDDESEKTMQMGGGKGADESDSDSLDWGAADEEAEKTLAMGKVAPVPQAKKPQKREEAMPSFDDDSQQADESFLDESMSGDETPQMDTEEDYSDLFDGGSDEKTKTKGSETAKPRKSAVKGGTNIKRLLIIVGSVVIVAGLGFAGYMFFLAPEPPKPTPVEIPKPRVVEEKPAPAVEPAAPAPTEPAEKTAKKKPEPASAAEKPAKGSKKAPKAAPAAPAEEPPIAAMPGEVAAGYYVQFGVFKSEANASRMVARVAEYGLKAVVEAKNGKNIVLLDEHIDNYKAASKRSQEVKKLTDFDTAVYRKK